MYTNQQQEFSRPSVTLKKFFLIESKGYQDQWVRPYEMNVGYEDLIKIQDTIERSMRLKSTSNIGPEIYNSSPNIMSPSGNVLGQAKIANGWSEKRFKFVLVLEESSGQGSNTTIINYIQGYSEFLGISFKNTLDPDMRLFVNTVSVLRKTYDSSTGRFNIVPINKFNSVQDELNLLDYMGSRFVPNSVQDHEAYKLARPEDVLINVSTLSSTEADTLIMSDVGNVNKFNIVDSENILPTQHIATTLTSAVDSVRISNAFTEGDDIINTMVGDTLSSNPTQILIFKMIYNTTGELRPNFTLKELSAMFQPMEVVPEVILGNDVGVMQMSNEVPMELQTNDVSNTYGADIETRKSILIHEAVVNVLNESLLSHIVFEMDNYNGAVNHHVLSADSEIEGLDIVFFSNKFANMFVQKVWNSISENNMLPIKVLISSYLVSDTTISISVDNRPMVIFRYPTFANSKFIPIIMDNARFDDISTSYASIVGTAIESSRKIMNEASKF